MEGILILDDFENSFRYYPNSISPCLFPVGSNLLFENLISWLKRSCIYTLTLVTASNSTYCHFKSYLTTISTSFKISIIEIDNNSTCFGDYIRNIGISLNLENDFVLFYPNTFLLNDIDVATKHHVDLKAKKSNLECTLLFSKMLPNDPLRSEKEQNLFLTSKEGRILSFYDLKRNNKCILGLSQLQKYKLGTNYSLKLNYDLAFTGIIICTNKLVEHFKKSFDFKSIDDYILNVTNDELETAELYSFVLDKPIGVDGHTLYIGESRVYFELSRLVPFSLDKFAKYNRIDELEDLTSASEGKIEESTVKNTVLHSTSHINASFVYNCIIKENSKVSNSIVFNSVIGSNVNVTNCIVISNSVFENGIKAQGVVLGDPLNVVVLRDSITEDQPSGKLSLLPPSKYSDYDSSNSSLSPLSSEDEGDKDEEGVGDITEFESEVYELISESLNNPHHIQYSNLELKGLRLVYNVQNIHVVQALLYPVINWLTANHEDPAEWSDKLEELNIAMIFSPFIDSEDKPSHFVVYSTLLRICSDDPGENDLQFCHVCEAFNSAGLLNFDFLKEWYQGLGEVDKSSPPLKKMRFKAFLNWLSEDVVSGRG